MGGSNLTDLLLPPIVLFDSCWLEYWHWLLSSFLAKLLGASRRYSLIFAEATHSEPEHYWP